ncbi:hypothetical protein H0H87_009903 [Tephrocybe sp. NHM501043]|nr:hypothetical protein H0H87_009903 [Tephrocybe sp. NHM501043]
MRTNGNLRLNGKKMSKSLGNFLTLRDGIKKFGADATRLSLADAGDGLEYANFEEKTANANILRVHTLLGWCEDVIKDKASLDRDDVFEHEMNELINVTQSHYENMNYKDAVKFGFYEFQSARDWYREVTSDVGKKGPGGPAAAFDPKLPKSVRICSRSGKIPVWRLSRRPTMEQTDKADDAKVKILLTERGLIKNKRLFTNRLFTLKRMAQFGAQTAFRRALPFSESQVLREILPYLKKSLGLVDAEVCSVGEARQKEGDDGFSKNIIDTSEPGTPAFEYRKI